MDVDQTRAVDRGIEGKGKSKDGKGKGKGQKGDKSKDQKPISKPCDKWGHKRVDCFGEHYTHEVIPFAEIILAWVAKPTHRGLQGGKRWHKGDAVFIKGICVGRSDLSDEHIVLTLGGRVFSRTIRRLEPSRRHDAGFLDKVKGLPWDAQDGIVRG